VIGRLRDGVTRSQAEARLEAIAAGLEQTNPESNEGVRPTFRTLRQALAPPALSALFYSMVAAAFGVLLIGCTNVANLLLARAAARTQEVAVRCALGASRSRVVVLLMSEVSILALIGGGIGFLLGHLGLRWFLVQVDYVLAVAGGGEEFPFWVSFEHDIRVVLFVILATATASVLAGLFPALKASATNVADAMKGAGRGEAGLRMARFSGGLIVAEVALSCVLLVLAGLFIRSITQLNNVELNYATENVYTARLELPESDYPDSSSRLLFFEELLSELRAIPGVETASLSDSLPPFHVGARSIEVEGEIYEDEHSFPIVRSGVITSDYFHTFETPLLLGRALSAMDRGGTSLVAVINESFARAYFPGDSALGRRFRTHFSDGPGDWLEVVGVVPDLKAFPMEADGVSREAQNPACFYVPLGQADPGRYMVMVLRTQGPPTSIADEVRNVVASLDSQLALFMELPMDGVILRMIWFYPVFSSVFMTFGFGALFLAAVGLYGMMSFAVAQRTREMGVRLALGAQRGQLVALVMRKGLIRIGIGLGLGLVFALLASAPLALLLFEVQGRDPAVIAMVVVTLAVTGLIACFIPARRVTSVDPATALGSE
jgi:predicted permease